MDDEDRNERKTVKQADAGPVPTLRTFEIEPDQREPVDLGYLRRGFPVNEAEARIQSWQKHGITFCSDIETRKTFVIKVGNA